MQVCGPGRTLVRGQWRLYCKLQSEMRVCFATSTLPCKLQHILVVRSEPNRAAIAPPTRRRRAAIAPPSRRRRAKSRRHYGNASRAIQVCSPGLVQGEPLLRANGVYTANYNTKCLSVFCDFDFAM